MNGKVDTDTIGYRKMPKRNYRGEYDNYHKQTDQKKRRASRNTARSKMKTAGRVKKGDGKDVAHKNGNPRDNKKVAKGIRFPENKVPKKNIIKSKQIIDSFLLSSLLKTKGMQINANKKNL